MNLKATTASVDAKADKSYVDQIKKTTDASVITVNKALNTLNETMNLITNSDEKSARRTGRYCRPSGLAKSTFKINDSLPAGLRSGTPIPAVQCGETMVACQLGSVVYLVHVPFIGVGTVPAEWCLEPWGSVDGTLLAVYVTEDEHIRLATTTSVYDTTSTVRVQLESTKKKDCYIVSAVMVLSTYLVVAYTSCQKVDWRNGALYLTQSRRSWNQA